MTTPLRNTAFAMCVALVATLLGCSPQWQQPEAPSLQYQHHWQRLKNQFISPQGRVIDLGSERGITTSEGQAYAMFMALVANDPATFAKLLRWTQEQLLADHTFGQSPAWLWGRNDQGQWQVLDNNAAADADIWMAYALLTAGKRWQQPQYSDYGRALANQVLKHQTRKTSEGLVLLPGPQGFVREHGFTINPSYFSLPLFIGLAQLTQDKRWLQVHHTSLILLQRMQRLGGIPDWVDVNTRLQITSQQTQADAANKLHGSYDAIRSYLWLRMEADRSGQSLRQLSLRFNALNNRLQQLPAPQQLLLSKGAEPTFEGQAPVGFYPAYAHYLGTSASQSLWQQVAGWPEAQYADRYYDTMLLLFGVGYNQCYRFTQQGALQINAASNCQASN
ncbi:cellulase [Idiomarina tyrosinivorans]|uniref:cellulase n=1 Tax=Idiomarina tyrosinivorans TaxID=1445662 RepID=A0A432ZSB8_9GAMM|nr:cellulose synthase complex periplasmic endoglucanase BcsZ [Idiomarina tyrosinivorans]RUO80815.1 cellulase [Idiomarina tyrosinivorans]